VKSRLDIRVATTSTQPIPRRRHLGVRLWLSLAFAAVGIIAGASVYIFVSGSSEQSAQERSSELAIGQTVRLGQQVEQASNALADDVVETARSESYAAWVFDRKDRLITQPTVLDVNVQEVPRRAEALRRAQRSGGYVDRIDEDVTVVAAPIVREGKLAGTILARADEPPEVREALEAVREDRITALGIAVGLAVLMGALIASLITMRLKRLAAGAAELAEGRLDTPLESGGRDEIGDLGRALERMRAALRDSFDLLSLERDTLSAILAALNEAVMVVSKAGEVRFCNPAAVPLISDGRPTAALVATARRAAQRGESHTDALRIGERVYAVSARELSVEDAILIVVRDRTEELRRELAEREFVSNAAHELRNPIAGISGSIEVLLAGAKDDPEAREHFLHRLAEDAERISRLTHALLTLARMEAVEEGEADVVDVEIAAEDATQAVLPPEDLEVNIDVEPGLSVCGEPALVRQVMISLLTNAYKHTPGGGTVTLRALAGSGDDAVIEVSDTGTGIPAEERDRIFERFYRGSNAIQKEGFGLGLSIARRMVELMDGEIGVRSEVGQGSTFWFRLPIPEPAPTPVA
jgi:signal transduction histidine kinase/HAMP domain-containing protein